MAHTEKKPRIVSSDNNCHNRPLADEHALIRSKRIAQVHMLTGGASCGPKGAMAPLDLQILHVMNSDFDTVHYCSKRVGPLILLKLEIKLRH